MFLSVIFLLISFKPTTTKAQVWEGAIPEVMKGAAYVTENWRLVIGSNVICGCQKPNNTCVFYAYGTYITDNPRCYRTPTELLRYWTKPEYVNRYGKVVDFLMYIDGQWRSVKNWRF